MTKYDEQFKLSVVRQYLDGHAGYTALGRQHGLAKSLVCRWVGWYVRHGAEGLKKKSSHYSAQFKLSVLQHMWQNLLSHGQTATEFNIRNPADVGMWERGYRSGGLDALLPNARGRPKQMPVPTTKPIAPSNDPDRSREELLAELNYLRMENAYLKKLRALVLAQQKATAPRKRR